MNITDTEFLSYMLAAPASEIETLIPATVHDIREYLELPEDEPYDFRIHYVKALAKARRKWAQTMIDAATEKTPCSDIKAREPTITHERLAEIEVTPREANIFKAEARELVGAYRERIPGLRVTKDADGIRLYFDAPSGKKASISLEFLASFHGPFVSEAIREWADALEYRQNAAAEETTPE